MKSNSLIKYSILNLILILNCVAVSGQYILTGKIVESKNHQPLPFVSVGYVKYEGSTITNETGIFKLNSNVFTKKDSLRISAIGFLNKTISLSDINFEDTLEIKLIENIYGLPVAEVNGNNAGKIVKAMIEKIPVNYSDTTFYSDALYLQYHRENNKYVRLIFADFCQATIANTEKGKLSANEYVAIRSKLRSKNLEQNNEEHGDHLMDMLKENPVYHLEGSPLNIKAQMYYKYVMDTTNTDESVYKILFYNTDLQASKKERGLLVIDAGTMALLSYSKEETINHASTKNNNPGGSAAYTWIFIKSKTEISFIKRDSLYYPLYFYKTYAHKLIDNKVKSQSFVVEENFEITYTDHYKNIPERTPEFTEFSNLYTGKLTLDPQLDMKFGNIPFHFADKQTVTSQLNEWDAKW